MRSYVSGSASVASRVRITCMQRRKTASDHQFDVLYTVALGRSSYSATWNSSQKWGHSRRLPLILTLIGPPATTDRGVGCTPARDLDADPESESASKRATLLSGRLGNVV